MTTAIEDSELDTELQELYLVNKQWIAELDFLEDEIVFLKKLIAKLMVKDNRQQALEKVIMLEKTYHDLKTDMMTYLHRSEALISHSHHVFDLALVETYTDLKQRLNNTLVNCHMVKNAIFACSKLESNQNQSNSII